MYGNNPMQTLVVVIHISSDQVIAFVCFSGIKEWMCNICSKGCATKSELKRHVMYHGGRLWITA